MLRALVEMTGAWASRRDYDEAAAERVRRKAICLNAERYARLVDVYHVLWGQARFDGPITVEAIVDELMLPCEVFKSYDPAWLNDADFQALTAWLGRRFFREPRISLDGVGDVDAWRDRLRTDRIHLSCSSGTSGTLSFVPRDPVASHAVRTNGPYSFHRQLPTGVGGIGDLACLVLAWRGSATGIQGAATGLARAARRSHYLFDEEVRADDLRRPARSARPSQIDLPRAHDAAVRFLRAAAADHVPILIFGTPFELERACASVVESRRQLSLPRGSLVVTGGGWKGERGVSRAELLDHVERAFGVPAHDVVDVYATTETNAVLLTCTEGRYHVPPLVEAVVVDEALERVDEDDAVGVLGLLDPFAVSYPGFLVTGDHVRLTRHGCPCGLSGPTIVGPIERAPLAEPKGCAGALATVAG